MADTDLKIENLRALTEDQLTDTLLKLKKEQLNLRFQGATGQLEKTARIREIRRGVARIKTLQREQRATEKTE